MKACLDSWAVLAWLQDKPHAAELVDELIRDEAVISWVNLVEVYYRTERDHTRERADDVLRRLRSVLSTDMPGSGRMIETARLKARHAIALGDCFAIATAAAHRLPLATGDPEILDLDGPPCELQDLRAQAA